MDRDELAELLVLYRGPASLALDVHALVQRVKPAMAAVGCRVDERSSCLVVWVGFGFDGTGWDGMGFEMGWDGI